MKRIKTSVFFVSLFWLVCLLSTKSHAAYLVDFAQPTKGAVGYRLMFEKFVDGTTTKSEEVKQRFCQKYIFHFLHVEIGKALYRETFHEMDSEEQVQDVEELRKNILKEQDCIERFKLWLTYDDKWYKAQRDKKWAEKQALEKVLEKSVKDTGEDVFDTVINGVFLSIPRKYIWFGSREKDGPNHAINLQFFYPDMKAHDTRTSSHPDYKGMRTNIGGVLAFTDYKALPCPGIPEKEICAESVYIRSARKTVGCRWGSQGLGENYDNLGRGYYGAWRGICKPKYEPEFDKDVGMMRIGDGDQYTKYYEGHFIFPDYWFGCKKPPILPEEGPIGICESSILIENKIYFKYSFPRELFWKHREIQDAVRAKLETFIIKKTRQ